MSTAPRSRASATISIATSLLLVILLLNQLFKHSVRSIFSTTRRHAVLCNHSVRVHILGPASVAIDSRSLSVSWPYGDVERDTLHIRWPPKKVRSVDKGGITYPVVPYRVSVLERLLPIE